MLINQRDQRTKNASQAFVKVRLLPYFSLLWCPCELLTFSVYERQQAACRGRIWGFPFLHYKQVFQDNHSIDIREWGGWEQYNISWMENRNPEQGGELPGCSSRLHNYIDCTFKFQVKRLLFNFKTNLSRETHRGSHWPSKPSKEVSYWPDMNILIWEATHIYLPSCSRPGMKSRNGWPLCLFQERFQKFVHTWPSHHYDLVWHLIPKPWPLKWSWSLLP